MRSDSLRILSTGMGWPSSQPGGLNTYFRSICESLSLRGNELHALVCSPEEPVSSAEGMNVVRIADPRSSVGRRRREFRQHAARLLDGKRVDLVYSHFAPYGIGAALEARRRRIPVVMAFHGPWSEEIKVEGAGGGGLRHRMKTAIAKSIERKAYGLADALIVLSETFRDILHRDYGVPLSRIHVIPGAADVRKFRPAADRELARSRLGVEGRTTVLTVRRLVHRMGLLQLVDAWREVAREAPDALLLIGGKGPLKEELERRIAAYGLEDSVRLLGYIPEPELPLYYQAADLFVVPTQALEGFGLITVEAMAAGLPVAATPVGGSREILQRFRPELLFRGTGSGDIAEGIVRALRDRGRWPTADECRAHVLEHYTWERAAERVEDVFRRTIRPGTAGTGSLGIRATEARATEAHAAVARATEARAAELKAVEPKAAGTQTTGTHTAGTRTAETRG